MIRLSLGLGHGIRFKPSKCKVILKGIRTAELYLYGNELEVVESHNYLGVYFYKKGINWRASMIPRMEAV